MNRWNVIFLAVGVAAVGWMVVHFGPGEMASGVARVGWGFPLVCAIHLSTLLLDALSLRFCAGQAGARVGFWPFARAGLAGHAINQVTPGGQLGELTKYTMLRDQLAPAQVASALVLQNLFWVLVNSLLVGLIPPIAVLVFGLRGPAATAFLAAAGVSLAAGALTLLLMRRGVGDWPFRLLARLRVPARRVDALRASWRRVEATSREAAGSGWRVAAGFALAALSRLVSAVEAFTILALLGFDASVTLALLSVATAQVVAFLTAFVPMQTGTAEGGSFLMFQALGLAPEAGVVMELVRRLRRIVFVIVGVAILGGAALRQIVAERGAARIAAAEGPVVPAAAPAPEGGAGVTPTAP